ncbi:MAG: SMR family transporter [Actinobacteria bacterium]|nr:SMR family transporter [Actinomycetota bacterium]
MIAIKIMMVLLVSATASLGNSMLKAGASHSNGGDGKPLMLKQLPRTFLRPAILAGVAVYGVSQFVWINVLRVVDLSLAYPLQIGLNFVLIMLVARWYFREPLTPVKLAGIVLIFVGIMTVAVG